MTPPLPQGSNNDIRGDIQQLLAVLQSNGQAASMERDSINRKLDAIPTQFADLRREQATQIEAIRRDMERNFVPISKYDPEYRGIYKKLDEYDTIIRESRGQQSEYVTLRETVKSNTEDLLDLRVQLKDFKSRVSGTPGRLIPFIGIVIAVLSFLFTFLQHVQIR